MKGLLSALLLGSGCLASAAGAQEVRWRAARPDPVPPPSLASCVTIGPPRPLPVAADPSPSPITQVAYSEPAGPARVVRLSPEPLDLPPVSCGPDLAPAADGEALMPDEFGADPSCFYARAEYLMWWFKGAQLPPLVTTGPADVPGVPGALGGPGTVVLFGGSAGAGQVRSGARLTAGTWCNDEHDMGIEASGFFIGKSAFRFAATSDQFPVLARPFFNLNAGAEDAQVSTAPGLSVGRVSVEGPSSLWGTEIDLRCNLCRDCDSRLDFVVGPRYVRLDEGLHIEESLLGLAGAGPFEGSHIFVGDRFDTHNQFFGGQVGLDYQLVRGPLSLGLTAKVGLGDTHQVVKTAGEQVIVSPSSAVNVANGGLLALPSNSGRFVRDRFAVLPEATANLGWQVTDWCRLSVGYNFLYWSSVVRPGDQIDRVIDVSQVPNTGLNVAPTGLPRPAPLVRATDFWAQGISLGVELRY
jgi:hypothetical protein